ncbi:peptide chain release factor N(5)-glutamine methyltransferase [Parafilimonas sp.]|uniref:peptide chain release factor N(5)-glutamine methyltransferase n=1 Tax=Parafilimonas sp. TaxID=1969739 RepID=UPI0039E43BAF
MTISEAGKMITSALNSIYEQRERTNIMNMVLEKLTGLSGTDRLIYKNRTLTSTQEINLKKNVDQLLQHKPVQYVLHEAWFAGMLFYVDENVLIPRPETEELVEWVLEKCSRSGLQTPSVLDIGAGSGCIAISIKKKLPTAKVFALDFSLHAIQIAEKNAEKNKVAVQFFQADILNVQQALPFSELDVVVSNPPYIMKSEAAAMRPNVLQHEPHSALFVPDDDALLFYKAITGFALQHLKNPGGQLYFEMNELLGEQVASLLHSKGFSPVEIKKDLQEKNRFVAGFLR